MLNAHELGFAWWSFLTVDTLNCRLMVAILSAMPWRCLFWIVLVLQSSKDISVIDWWFPKAYKTFKLALMLTPCIIVLPEIMSILDSYIWVLLKLNVIATYLHDAQKSRSYCGQLKARQMKQASFYHWSCIIDPIQDNQSNI